MQVTGFSAEEESVSQAAAGEEGKRLRESDSHFDDDFYTDGGSTLLFWCVPA